jgi:hypothetical protein
MGEPTARRLSAPARDLVARQQGRFPWSIPSAWIRRHASMMACRFSFSALLTACPDVVAMRRPGSWEIEGS